MIYHVVSKTGWETAIELGHYEASSLSLEGFIHCSKKEQLKGVLERYYKGQKDLLLLHIDEEKLTAPLQYEHSPSVNEMFPHIYGRLNIAAVACAKPISEIDWLVDAFL
jgi:uncharacterized protein (DUF952 family)